jgi:hypothetical protein
MNVKIVLKDDTISYEAILNILKGAFCEWLDNNLISTVSNYKKEDLLNLTKNGDIFIAIDEDLQTVLGVCGFNIFNINNLKYCYCSFLAVNNLVKSQGIGTLLRDCESLSVNSQNSRFVIN